MGTGVTTDATAGGSVISLPTGGGAISGLGEKFAPDLFTGTGNFSVPIATPPGRAGQAPSLALAYSSGSGTGPFGLGWTMTCGYTPDDIYDKPSGSCTPPTARPGMSMHEKGLAIDFANCSSQSTKCCKWLNANAGRYGLRNLASEPWPWSTTGT